MIPYTSGQRVERWILVAIGGAVLSACVQHNPRAGGAIAARLPASDSAIVAALDERYQKAVKANDAAAMDSILAVDFALITGRGTVITKEQLLVAAREHRTIYERQDVETRTVRVWGDAAVVTALLWVKGSRGGQPVDYRLWFSDTYVRSKDGWRYVLGQASLPLPAAAREP